MTQKPSALIGRIERSSAREERTTILSKYVGQGAGPYAIGATDGYRAYLTRPEVPPAEQVRGFARHIPTVAPVTVQRAGLAFALRCIRAATGQRKGVAVYLQTDPTAGRIWIFARKENDRSHDAPVCRTSIPATFAPGAESRSTALSLAFLSDALQLRGRVFSIAFADEHTACLMTADGSTDAYLVMPMRITFAERAKAEIHAARQTAAA